MRLVRFMVGSTIDYGILDTDVIRVIASSPYEGGPLDEYVDEIGVEGAKVLTPVQPSKIVAVGLNYRDHIAEAADLLPHHGISQDSPQIVFGLRAPSALIGPNDYILKPRDCLRLDYEAELAVIIARRGRRIAIDEVQQFVLGYTCYNDCTDRELQKRGPMFSQKAKCRDTFAPCGPWIETEFSVGKQRIQCIVNGQVRQEARLSDMVWSVPVLISHISQFMTLMPGDLITTGSPRGIGPLEPGDRVDVVVEGIGTLTNYVLPEGEGTD